MTPSSPKKKKKTELRHKTIATGYEMKETDVTSGLGTTILDAEVVLSRDMF